MLFASYEFITFLILLFPIYYLVPKSRQWQVLLIAGYVFYWIADPRYLIFIVFTSATVYYAAKKINKSRTDFEAEFELIKKELSKEERKEKKEIEKKKERRWMLAALLFNIGILAVLKYTNFVIVNINTVRQLSGNKSVLPFIDMIVPMGISFYTFQAVGYLLDVYHGKCDPEESFLRFALFVSFFPQLVQGPISRYSELAKTLYKPHEAEKKELFYGLERILWGYFKKLVIADRILVAVNTIIHDPDEYGGVYVFIGMLFYALELYADFTGGIDITIGIAQMLGIKVTENFQRPYFSKSIKEYWKRWHITMGTWFTDYIFYPMSVSKSMQKLNKFARKHFGDYVGKRLPVYICSFVVWMTTGIWHGASWNFIVWGLGNYVLIMISDELSPLYNRFHSRFNVLGRNWYKCFQVVRTVLLMSVLRLLDCYRNVPLTFRMLGSMFSDFNIAALSKDKISGLGLTSVDYSVLIISTAVLIIVSMVQRSGSVRERISKQKLIVQYIIWFSLFVIIILLGAYGVGYDESQFIYNQF